MWARNLKDRSSLLHFIFLNRKTCICCKEGFWKNQGSLNHENYCLYCFSDNESPRLKKQSKAERYMTASDGKPRMSKEMPVTETVNQGCDLSVLLISFLLINNLTDNLIRKSKIQLRHMRYANKESTSTKRYLFSSYRL